MLESWEYKPIASAFKDKYGHVRYVELQQVVIKLEVFEGIGHHKLYKLTLETDNGIWEEEMTNPQDAEQFLRGVKAALATVLGDFQDLPTTIDEIRFRGDRLQTPVEAAAGENFNEHPMF